jgi:cytochrome b subunit of formate dehydrogenase
MSTTDRNTTESSGGMIFRFRLPERIEHIILLVSFTGLALTGLPQKFVQTSVAVWLITLLGGIETVRIIHRVFATLLMATGIYHGGSITYKLFVLGQPPYLLPRFSDFTDLIQTMAFNLGLRDEHPRMGRFNFEEKLEYWAVIWGMAIMILTGFMLWNPIATTRFLPGQVIPAAKIAHGNEAVLAVLAIIIWHMYNVLVAHRNLSMFSGKINRAIMEEEHAQELEAIERGETPQPPPPDVYRRRMKRFVPFAVVMTILLLAGLIWFVTFEQSAITTIPPMY